MADFEIKNLFWYGGGLHVSPTEDPAVFDRIKTTTLNPNDVIVATYRKAGSTWVSSILDLVFSDGDLQSRDALKLDERVRLVDLSLPHRVPRKPELDYVIEAASPRLMLTHLPYPVFKKQVEQDKAKVVVVVRNPKDTLVSYYHFYRAVRNISFPHEWGGFFELTKAKKLIGGDFFEYYQAWWQQKDRANVYFLHYEDLKRNPVEEIQKLAAFCDKPLDGDSVKRIVEHTTFEKMKENPAVNHRDNRNFNQTVSKFMRKGEVGDWENYFTPEQNAYIEERTRETGGLKFKYSL